MTTRSSALLVKCFLTFAVMCVLSVGWPADLFACPVCYTDPNSSTSNALSYAIVVLLGVTGSVLGGFAGLFLYLRKRTRKMTSNGITDFPHLN
jgi:hypothetical protein